MFQFTLEIDRLWDLVQYNVNSGQHNLNVEEDVHSSSSHHIPSYNLHANLNRRRVYTLESARNNTRKGSFNKEIQRFYIHSPMRPHPKVAEGIIISKDPHALVGGEELGNNFYEIFVDKVIFRLIM